MAITDYTSLKAAIEAWTHRSDLTNVLDDFIDMAEQRINRDMRVSQMETRATTTANQEYIGFPSDALEIRNIQITANGMVYPLGYMSPEQLDMRDDGASGQPAYWTVIGDDIQLEPSPDGDYTMEIAYYKEITPLDETNTTNWVLEQWPELYLHGCLHYAWIYAANPEKAALHLQYFDDFLRRAHMRDRSRKAAGSSLVVRSA